MATAEEKELMVRELMEIFRGRFDSEGAKRIYERVNWDQHRAMKFVFENNPSVVTRVTTCSEDTVKALKTDPEVLEALRDGIKSTVRQFACGPCDNVWWWRVPVRKEVSKCRFCKVKYDPVPREREWGWAIFDCECGNQFSSYGEMNVTACECYKCGRIIYSPSRISRTNRHGRRKKTGNTHSCLGIGCGDHDHVEIHEGDPDRVYDDEEELTDGMDKLNIDARKNENRSKNKTFHCLSPQYGNTRKRVVHPSQIHKTTGSTVGTFLPQDDIASTYVPSLPSIKEYTRTNSNRKPYTKIRVFHT